MSEFTIKDKIAIAGLGETKYYKRGAAPVSEFRLASKRSPSAADDAGIDVTDIDGFASYSNDRNDPRPPRDRARDFRICASPTWCGAAAAVAARARSAMPRPRWSAGYAKYVCGVSRARAGPVRPLRPGARRSTPSPAPPPTPGRTGMSVPAQWVALRTRRFMHDHRITQDPLARGRDGRLSPRPIQSARGDVRPAADARGTTTTRDGSSSRFISTTAAWKTTAPPR